MYHRYILLVGFSYGSWIIFNAFLFGIQNLSMIYMPLFNAQSLRVQYFKTPK